MRKSSVMAVSLSKTKIVASTNFETHSEKSPTPKGKEKKRQRTKKGRPTELQNALYTARKASFSDDYLKSSRDLFASPLSMKTLFLPRTFQEKNSSYKTVRCNGDLDSRNLLPFAASIHGEISLELGKAPVCPRRLIDNHKN